ncbi:hypothetical protein [Pigmentiphaga litoralis]|uniref:Uncharacterized protein n=1 Tax=Pigmentiphaga litoralis TaxID=516702 RepID=A0A7Y9LMY7_9BURK|nr:hypothetical protein [Pigmentiphaga litoralis]NYE23631.1 hypothetical protein [Pigmentiphaga litoralis]NYE82755.1 hypothetical protein [Pigmentiphaga litoralis]
MLTKKDVDAIDDIQAGRKEVDDTHLADAAEPTPEERRAAQEVAAGDDGKMHLGKNFGEALVDILVPGAGSHTGDFARPTDPAAPTVVTPITSDTDKK